MDSTLGQILFLVLLTLLEGFFVAAEIALVAVRRSRVDQLVDEGNASARRVRRLLDDPGRFLAVSQLGLTVIGFFASAYAAVNLVQRFSDFLVGLGMKKEGGADTIALIVVTVVLALFTIIFAELVPKTLALANTERFAIALSLPIEFLARALGPLIRVLTGVTAWIAKLFGANVSNEAQITAEELRLIVERGGEQGVLEAEEEQMINSIIELGERRLHEVMIPRIAIVSLAADTSLDEAIDKVVDEGHSRIPVYEESIDEVVG